MQKPWLKKPECVSLIVVFTKLHEALSDAKLQETVFKAERETQVAVLNGLDISLFEFTCDLSSSIMTYLVFDRKLFIIVSS